MIQKPPGLRTIITGLGYALQLSMRRCEPSALPPDTTAIWDALWFRYMLILLQGSLVLEFNQVGAVAMLVVLGLVDTLSYPAVSHFILKAMRMGGYFPQFILAVTWVGNLRVIILLVILLLLGRSDIATAGLYLFPFAVWMIWATWSAATRSMGGKGWPGAGMILVMMMLEAVNGALIITFLHPLLTQG